MGFDKGSDAFKMEAMGAGCDEEGLADGYCKEAWGGSVGLCVIVRGSEDVQMQQSGICSLLGLRLAGLMVPLLLLPLGMGRGRGGAGPTMEARFLRFLSAAVLFDIIIVSHHTQQETGTEHT